MKQTTSFFVIGIISINLTGCGHSAGKYEPITDGEKNLSYYDDLGQCQKVAEQRSYLNDDVKSSALAGAAIGGLLGVADSGGDALAGAVVGAVAGAAGESWETREDRKDIVTECMKGRGHKVVG
jgi:outer membrane lipoprotein SlyB